MTKTSAACLGVLWLLVACSANPVSPAPTLPAPALSVSLPPDPQGTASAYLESWERRDYAGMYSLLTPLSQAAFSQQDFTARYAETAAQLTLTNLETSILASLQSELEAEVQFRVSFQTQLVGNLSREITLPLRCDGERWGVAWEDGLILPELKGGNSLFMDYQIPARANIYDRSGLALAAQAEAVAIGVVPGEITDESTLLGELSTLLNLRPEALQAKYQYAQPDWYVPLGEAPAEAVSARSSVLLTLSGLLLNTYPTRFYLNGALGAPHAVGYVASIPAESLSYYQSLGYLGDEQVGLTGLEAWGEAYLAGKRGGTLYVVSPGGQVVTTLAKSESAPGQAITTTLEREFQMQVTKALGELPGAAVVLNPQTGEVLAFASSPAFDPNLFDPTNANASALNAAINNPNRPLINRVTQALYPPGSTFKVVTVATALASGLFTRDTIYNCTSTWDELGPGLIKYDWTAEKGLPAWGEINLVDSLIVSCNPYNYHIGLTVYNVDPNLLPNMAQAFGLGQPTGIVGLLSTTNEEVGGLVPDSAWKQRTDGQSWSAGDNVNMAIGQGDLLVTPVQMANLYAAIANGGTLYRPQLVLRIAAPGEPPVYEFKPEVIGQLPLTADQLEVIRDGLLGVTTDRRGTARQRFLGLGISIFGKTGTAEDPGGAPDAWFVGYTQAEHPDKPDIVVAVVLQNKGEGSEWAAPIFRRIVEEYFFGRAATLYPWEAEIGLTATPTEAPTSAALIDTPMP